MASTYSALKIELIATGEQAGTWGATTNVNLGDAALGEAITGSADVAFSSADVTVTLTDTNATQTARNLRLNLTGTSGGARNLILGSGCQIEKLYLVNNGLADAVTIKNTTGTGIAIPAGKSAFVFNNGTNVVDAVTYLSSLTTTQVNITGQGDLRLEDTSGGEYVALQAPTTLASSYTLTMPVDDGTNGQALITDGSGNLSWSTAASGDVYGPASATDEALARFDLTTGKLIQNSVGILSDAGILTGLTGLTSSGSITFSSLTSGRVTYAGASGLLSDSANLVFNGTQLGIATNSPIYTLDVNGDVKVTNTLRYYVGATQYGLSFANAGAVGTEAYQGTYIYWGTGSSTSATERMRITSAGLVGIGTSNPQRTLSIANGGPTVEIDPNGGTAGPIYFNYNRSTATYITPEYWALAHNWRVSGGTSAMTLDSSGNLGLGVTPSAYGKFAVFGVQNVTTYGNVSAIFSDAATCSARIQHNSSVVQFSSDTALAFGAGGSTTEYVRITSTGNVGIGTSSPSYLLDVNNTSRIRTGLILNPNTSSLYATDSTLSSYATNNGVYLNGFAGGTLELQADGTQATAVILTGNSSTVPNIITFKTASTERMRLDSSGNLGLGVNPSAWGTYKALQGGSGSAIGFRNDGNPITLYTANLYVDGTNYRYISGSSFYGLLYAQDATSGKHTWQTAPSSTGIATLTQAMTLDASGRLLVGTTSTTCGGNTISAGGVNIEASANFATGITTPAGNQYAMLFANGTNGIVGSIYLTSTTTTYNTSSDQRLKTNIVDAPSGNIDSIKVRSFDWILNGSHQEYGMVAQELIEVAPYAVTKTDNPDDMMQVDYSKLVPMMIKEIQELKQRITTLENK